MTATPVPEGSEARPDAVIDPPTKLAGPEGHPFHPILVTIPIGAWVSSLGFDIGGRISSDEAMFARGAMWLIWIGIGGALLASVFGLLDLRSIPRETPARATALVHMGLNALAVGVWFVDAMLRVNSWQDSLKTEWWGFVLSSFALVCVGASGHLGGRLAYHFGIRVGSSSMQAEGFVHTDDPAHVEV